jgi:hypothetical protein
MKKLFGLFGSEKATVLTVEEKLEIISNKAQDTYDFGPTVEGDSEFRIGTDGYEVEEISPEDAERLIEEARKAATIDRLLADPSIELRLENGQHVEAGAETDPWSRISNKGRVSGGN